MMIAGVVMALGFHKVLTLPPRALPSGAQIKKWNMEKIRFYVEIEYDDDSSFHFNVEFDDDDRNVLASLMMITRGTLMASSAYRAIAYDMDGFDVCSYINTK